jgi:hypothetical protein
MTTQRCRVLAVTFALAAVLAACGGDRDSRVETSDPTRATAARPTTTATDQPTKVTAARPITMATDQPAAIATWCVDWLELGLDPALFDAALDKETAIVEIERLAQRGTELHNPVIATASADIVEYITWPDRLPANP